MERVVALTEADADAAGALLAARHARERKQFPLLPEEFEHPARAADLVRSVLSFCDGVAAVDEGGSMVGFLTSFESRPDPASPMARFAPERSSLHLVHGHAVDERADAFRTYAVLFSVLAERAMGQGITDHVVHVPIGAPTTEAAWAALGFGRINVVAVRDLSPLGREIQNDVDVRVATAEDLDVVDRLIDEEAVFHAGSPIFRPYRRRETVDAVRAELGQQLTAPDHAFFIARDDRRDIGVLSMGPGRGSPLYVPDGATYIGATAVVADARRVGAGTGLVDTAFAWAAGHGHAAACLHFSTANVTSTSFWTGIGFTPVMAHLRRRVDEQGRRPGTI